MLFNYEALTKEGELQKGSIDALNEDIAVISLQQRGLTIVSIQSSSKKPWFKELLDKQFSLSRKVPVREIVILSRQIATLFAARVAVLKVFRMLSDESASPLLQRTLNEVASDVQGGLQIADALAKHPLIFSSFYINMVRAGEESGKLKEAFNYLADYLNRSYELTTKARNALLYPAFVISAFILVMVLLLTVIFPKLSEILEDTGQEIPFYTKVVISISDFLVSYGVFILATLIFGILWLFRFSKNKDGKMALSRVKLNFPVLGGLARKFYLSRIADSMHLMLTSGVSLVKTMEITATVVGDAVYEAIAREAAQDVKSGTLVSESFRKHEEVPGIMVQIIRAGEETGELGNILKTIADFYRQEVNNMVDGLVGLIEPALIVALGAGIGIVVASVLIPIYNIATGF